jgi:hypothetical protein
MGKLAPDITTVSKPKIKPASAAINEMPNKLLPPFALLLFDAIVCIKSILILVIYQAILTTGF